MDMEQRIMEEKKSGSENRKIDLHIDELEILKDFLEQHLVDMEEVNENDGYLLGVYHKVVNAIRQFDRKNYQERKITWP